MSEAGDLRHLLKVHAWRPEVLSLYLILPRDLAELRGIPRVGEFLAEAAGGGLLTDADRTAVRETLQAHGSEWPGRTVAIFTSAGLGLHEVMPLARAPVGYEIPERAVLAYRPHILPLLAAVQWYPAYQVAIVNRRHAWLLSVGEAGVGDTIETVVAPHATGMASTGAHQRVTELASHHYRDAAAMLAEVIGNSGPQPLVIGGQADCVRDFFAYLPTVVRESFAGSFAAEPHALTPSMARDLAAPTVARAADQAARGLVAEISLLPPGGLGAVGLPACLTAVNDLAVERLVAPVDRLIPGYACGTCGQLGAAARCAQCRAAAAPIPDLVDEMACRVLEDGGHVVASRGGTSSLAARLRFPVPARKQVS